MSYKDIVKIKSKNITGIINPQVIIEGYIIDEKVKVKVYADGKEVKSKLKVIGNKNRFMLVAILSDKDKKIKVSFMKRNKEVASIKLKNTKMVRINYKINAIMKKILKVPKSIGKSIKFLWKEHHFLVPRVLWKEYRKRFKQKVGLLLNLEYNHPFKIKDYNKWIDNVEKKPVYKKLSYQPLISILIPTYNIGREYLSECIDSVLNQHYKNFEICLADDNSTSKETIETLKEYEKKDKRIKVVYRKENGHISKATNTALKMAKGEFVGLMDNDDLLTENALYEMVYALNQNKELDLIYSDEDKLDMSGRRCEPHFKPDYSPDTLLGGNYICHFEILRKSIVDEIGGERSEFVGAQDFDLFLRFVEKTTPDRICHIPKILYHWRKVPGSTADTIENKEYAIEAGKKAVEEAMKRRKKQAEVIVPIESTQYIVEYKYKKEPKVSIIIPTRDYFETLDKCLKSIYKNTTYKNYEIIIVNNDSKEKETIKLFSKYKKKYSNFKVVEAPGEFNFPKINNIAVKECTGKYLLFLNNDTEVITPTWINSMVGYAMQEHIGAVGPKLLYPDDTIQHGGVVVGIEGAARHAFLHSEMDSFGFYGRLLVPYNYSAVTAACMMIEKKKFIEVGKFNEDLKVALNDIDLNLKLLEKGYYNVFLPQVELYHYESKSRGLDTTSKKYQQFLEEKKYFQNKWKKYINKDPFYNENLSLKYDFMLDKKKQGE